MRCSYIEKNYWLSNKKGNQIATKIVIISEIRIMANFEYLIIRDLNVLFLQGYFSIPKNITNTNLSPFVSRGPMKMSFVNFL